MPTASSSCTVPLYITVSQRGRQLCFLAIACVYMHNEAHTHYGRGYTLTPLIYQLPAQPYLYTHTLRLCVHYCFPQPLISHRAECRDLAPLHAAIHISLQLLYQSALSTVRSILLEEQRRYVQRKGEARSFFIFYRLYLLRWEEELSLY